VVWLAGQVFLLCLVSFFAGAGITALALRLKPAAEDASKVALGASSAPKATLAAQEPPVAEEEELLEEPDVREATEPVIIKASRKSMRYHTPDSPYYNRVKGDLAFPSTDEAELAGYTAWNRTAVKN
jgi:hypothetical protein